MTAARSGRALWGDRLLLALTVLVAILWILPVIWVVTMSLKPNEVLQRSTWGFWPTPFTTENFENLLRLPTVPHWLLNSFLVAISMTLLVLAVSSLAGYAFARLRFPGRNVLFLLLLSALMVPQQVTVIPTFILIRNLGLLDTHEAIYLPATINVFGIFLLRQFFLSIPRELEDSARIDGAGHLRILLQIVVPLSGPAISSLAIFVFQAAWNDFFWPNLFLTTPEKMTLPLGLVSLKGQYGGGSAVALFAAMSMIAIPILVVFAFTQRFLTESIATTGMKG